MTIGQIIANQSYWTKQPELRFIKRDGKMILQYLQVRNYNDRQENHWLDVPVAEENK